MKKVIWTIIIIVVLILLGWLISATGDDTQEPTQNNQSDLEFLVKRAQEAGLEVTEGSVLIDLDEQNNSGIAGIAVLTELNNQNTRIAVSLDDTEGLSRPIHIHAGTCDDLGEVEYPLQNVVDEFSNSEIAVTFEDLEAGAPFAINAHESEENIENYISCGNLGFEFVADAEVIEGAGGGSTDDTDQGEDEDTATSTDEDDDSTTDESDDDEADAEAEAAVITYTNAGFDPQTLLVEEGTTVRFENESSGNMWVASAVHPTHEILPSFDQGTAVGSGGQYEFTFDQLGTWNFHNHVSANHTGTIIVE